MNPKIKASEKVLTPLRSFHIVKTQLDCDYTYNRAYQWARWIANEDYSLQHRAGLIRLIKITAPPYFFNLVGIIVALLITGKQQFGTHHLN